MDEVELGCAVYGEGSMFPVKIARDAKVSALQEVIAGIVSTEEHVVPPRLVTLYLAKKDGAWLKDDRRVKKFLRAGKSAEYEEEMRPTWTLDDEEYFGDFQLGEEEIHVLVELPNAAGGENSPTAQMGKEIHDQVVQTKRKRYFHSKMDSGEGRDLLQDLNIHVEPVRTVPFAR